MTSSIRSLTKQTLIYGVGTILARLVTFLLLPLYTNILPAAEYGLASLVFAFNGFMIIIFNYGLDSAMMRYYGESTEPAVRKRLLSTSIWLTISTSLILSGLIYGYSGFLGRVLLGDAARGELLRYSAGILFFDAIAHVPFALLRLEEQPIRFMSIRLLNVIMMFGLNIYFVAHLQRGVAGIFQSNLITSAVTTTILFILIIPRLSLQFSGESARNLILFGLPFIPAGLATVCMEMLNRYILEHLMGLEAVGVFSAGFKLGIFMLLLTNAFYYAWQPFFLKAGPQESSRLLFARIFTYFVLVELIFWLVLTALMPEIVRFHIGQIYLIGKEYQSCEPMVPIILMGYVFLGIYQMFLPGIYFEKKTRYLAYLTIFAALVNVGFNFILIPSLGILGSAFSSLIGYFTLAVCSYFVSQRLFRVPYELRRVGLLFLLTLAGGIPIWLFRPNLTIRITILVVYPLLLWLAGFFKSSEIAKLKQIFSKTASHHKN
ncbi:MAG TPA: oligosaccharide flippase family protein [Candidatus Marinimicrobia bacterium]|nr:oligosaccharide flippase family protein [Candidatus Neomarinimicrobiota bacterium]